MLLYNHIAPTQVVLAFDMIPRSFPVPGAKLPHVIEVPAPRVVTLIKPKGDQA